MADVLAARGITKNFSGVQALKDVSFSLRAGEIHALVGENGAGKSTLIKILSGVHQPDAGELWMNGTRIRLRDPRHAQSLGIATIFQEPLVFPDLSALENLFVGFYPRQRGRIDWGAMRRRAEEVMGLLGAELPLLDRAARLSAAQRQLLAAARALLQDARVLILDEPTSSLSDQDAQRLFAVVRQLRERGIGVIYISHRLEEVFRLADRVTVLRDGEHVATCPISEITPDQLIRHMVGRSVASLFPKREVPIGPVALEVERMRLAGVVEEASFVVRRGEIVGMFGLVGSGRSELAQMLVGILPHDGGTVRIDGVPRRFRGPWDAIACGLYYVPEDRQRQGTILPLSVAHNLTLSVLGRLSRLGMVRQQAEHRLAARCIEQLRVRASGTAAPVASLSGGNQQKVVLGKALVSEPRILVLDEPTRGIDVQAKAEIHRLMGDLAEQGLAILLISSELPEVIGMSDRVLVMHRGRLAGELSRQEATRERVMALATGLGDGVVPWVR